MVWNIPQGLMKPEPFSSPSGSSSYPKHDTEDSVIILDTMKSIATWPTPSSLLIANIISSKKMNDGV